MKGIFYNSTKALCSIWESGKMCYDALKKSNMYTLDYSEEKQIYDYNEYDFIIFNYHISVNNWITEEMLNKFNKPNFAIITEVYLNGENPISTYFNAHFFKYYIILDPTIKETSEIFAFVRPIENYEITPHSYVSTDIPEIFSFGFATNGKEWHKIVELVQQDFDVANIHFNIPKGTHVNDNTHNENIKSIYDNINKILFKPEIKFKLTNDELSKAELIEICSKKTINCFYYNRENICSHGLSAVTDQAISSGRPLLITGDNTFRHIHKYVDYYPNISLKQAIETTQEGVLKMKNEWSSLNFMIKFEGIFSKINNILS
jgi:hypothetical protein